MDPISVSAPLKNPFHAAAQEGAALTIAALLEAGLHKNPAFRLDQPGPEGASLLTRCLPLSAGPLGEPILTALLSEGLDPFAEAPLPRLPEPSFPFESSARLTEALSAPVSALRKPPKASAAELSVLFPHPGALAVLRSLSPERLRWLAAERDAFSAAAAVGNIPALRLLAEAGADPNALDSAGEAPLSRCRSAPVISCLFELGADLGVVSSATGKSCLNHFMSARFGAAGKEILAVVTERARLAPARSSAESLGPNLSESQRALASAAFTALAADNPAAARSAILSLGPDAARVAKPSGENLLLAACRAKNWAEAARLLGFGCDICAMDLSGDSPLLLLSTARSKHFASDSAPFYNSRGAEIADKWARSRAGGKGGANIPWERLSPSGKALIEPFHGTVNRLGDFWKELAPAALRRGWSPWRKSGANAPFAHGLLGSLAREDGQRRHWMSAKTPVDPAATLAFFHDALPLATPQEARSALDEALGNEALVLSFAPRRDYYSGEIPARTDLIAAVEALAQRADLTGWASPEDLSCRSPALAARIEALAIAASAAPSASPAARPKRI